jgi:AcrR family transcriptional regulator
VSSLTETPSPAPGAPASAQEAVARYRHGRVPREVRERQLVELGAALFAERGYAAASMDELARRAGVSKPVIYGLFGSKQGLFLACTEELGRELTDVVTAALERVEGAEALLRAGSLAFIDFVRRRAGLWAAAYAAAPTPIGAKVTARVSEIRRRQNELVRGLIVTATAELDIELTDEHAEGMARAINGMFEGLAIWAIERPEIPAAAITDWVVQLTIPGFDAMVGGGGN